MRKTITLLSAAAVALTALAAPQFNRVPRQHRATLGMERSATMDATKLTARQAKNVRGGFVNGSPVLADNLQALNSLSARGFKAPAKAAADSAATDAPDIIIEKPEGTDAVFSRSGDALTYFFGYVLSAKQDGYALNYVTAADGKTIYFKDFISQVETGSWVKGELTDDGFEIPLGQWVLYDEEEGYGIKLAAGKYTEFTDEDGQTSGTYELCDSIKSVKFLKQADGSYKIEDTFTTTLNLPDFLLSYFYSDDGSWSVYSDWNTSLTPFNDTVTLMPEGAKPEGYVFAAKDYTYDESTTTMLQCATVGDKFYIAGLNEEDPEACAVGTIADGKVTFAQDQYMGLNYGVLSYLAPATFVLDTYYDEVYEEEVTDVVYSAAESISLTADADLKTLKAPEKTSILLNSGKPSVVGIYYLTAFDEPTLTKFVEVAAVPATPIIEDYVDAFSDYGYVGMQNDIPTFDVDGNFIDPGKMSYIVWDRVDGQEIKHTFYADEYPGITALGVEELTEIPYNFESEDFTGDTGIAKGGYVIYFFEAPGDAIGLQSIYTGGGVRHESPICWYDTSAVKGIATDSQAAPVAIYGLDGVKRGAMQQGVNIVRMSDGSVRKVLVNK